MIFKQKKIKKLLPIVLGLCLGVFLFGSAALALDTGVNYGTALGLGTADLRVGIMQIIRYFLGFLGVLAILIMLYGGFVWMTAGGNSERIGTAKKIIINGIIGLVIIFSSFMLASFIITQLERATGAGGGGPAACAPLDQCVACNTRCDASGIIQFDASCSGACIIPPIPACSKPATPTPTICKIEDTRGFSSGLPPLPQGAPGDFVTIEGWYFGAYIAGTSKVKFGTTETSLVQCSGAAVWQENAGNNYGIARVQVPAVPTAAEYGVTLTTGTGDASGSYQYRVVTGPPIPGLACIQPPAAENNQTLDRAEGVRFGAAAGQMLFRNNQAASFLSWSDTVINNPVVPPLAVSGNAAVIDASSAQSNGIWFAVSCSSNLNCATGCCEGFTCRESAYCLPGAGDSCDPDLNTVACEPNGVCQPGLTCGSTDCTCRLPTEGEPCSSLIGFCSPGICANDLTCSPTTCLCEQMPTIQWVDPYQRIALRTYQFNGAAGNLITIHGAYFGSYVAGTSNVQFTSAAGWVDAPLASSINADCNLSWTDTEIIVVVPATADITGPIRVVREAGRFDATNDSRGPLIVDFDPSGPVRPGLCQIDNVTDTSVVKQGHINDEVKLAGDKFTAGSSQAYFADFLAGGIPNVLDSKHITGLKVPALRSGDLSVRVQDSAMVCVGGDHNGDPCTAPADCLPDGECKNIVSNAVSFTVLPEPIVPDAQCVQADAGVYLDGNGDSIFAPGPPLGPAVSLELWVKPEDITTGILDTVLNWSNNFNSSVLVQIDSATDQWYVGVTLPSGSTSQLGNYVFIPGQWYHFLLSLNSANQVGVLYINGEAQTSLTLPVGGMPLAPVNLGSSGLGFTDSFKGTLDDFGLYQRALSGVEALHLAQNQRLADDALYHFWRFNNSNLSELGASNVSYSGDAHYVTGHFLCTETISCDRNTSTPACDSQQSLCPAGTACDPNSCACVAAQACDSQPLVAACQPGVCPGGLFCDSQSNCTCQPQDQNAQDSTYTWTFSTTAFGPYVVEKCNRTGDCSFDTITSPTPFNREGTDLVNYRVSRARPDDGAVPIDAIIGAQFSTKMYWPNLTATGDGTGTVRVLSCTGPGTDCNTDVTPADFQVYDCGSSLERPADCFKFTPPPAHLQPNTWYEVRLDSKNIYGDGTGVSLASNNANGDYRWVFKTRDSTDLSQIACIHVEPPTALSPIFNDRKNWTGDPEPEGFSCVIIAADRCTAGWDWDTPTNLGEAASGYNPPRAAITDQTGDPSLSADEAYSLARSETIPNPPVKVTAECRVNGITDPFIGQGLLTIDFTSPYVLEKFPSCGSACLNALIGARFSKPMDIDKDDDDPASPTSLQNNISLHICYDQADCAPTAANTIAAFPATVGDDGSGTKTYVGYVPCVDYNGDGTPDYCLLPNTYYRVVINGNVTEETGIYHLKGLNYPEANPNSYSWVFKTKANYGLCLPERVEIVPTEKTEDLNKLVLYAARGYTSPDRCEPVQGQRLNPYSWSWGWNSVQASGWVDPGECSSGTGPPPGNAALGFTAANLLSDAGLYCTAAGPNGNLRNACGNLVIELGEECDDGNLANSDGCSASCNNEGSVLAGTTCGNGSIEAGEDCDDRNTAPGDGCSAICLNEGNNNYSGQVCGNGFIDTNEECDPPGPGCSDLSSGLGCRLTGSVTGKSLCGDGQIGVGEECDGGELVSGGLPADGDGCSASCLIEPASFLRLRLSFCRSNTTNAFNFTQLCGNTGSSKPWMPPQLNCDSSQYSCVKLITALGSFIDTGAVCGNRVVERGEECDLGRICADNGKTCSYYNERNCGSAGQCQGGDVNIVTGSCSDNGAPCNSTNKIGCFDPTSATCQSLGCSPLCTNTGSVEIAGRVGPYQIAQTLLDGEAYLQAWLPAFIPTRGPFGQAHLVAGEGLGGDPNGPGLPRIIARWPDCGSACINADIGAQFNQTMNSATLPPNVRFYDCGGDRTCAVNQATLLNVTITPFNIAMLVPPDAFRIQLPPNYNPVDQDNNPATLPIPALVPNTTYRVVVTKDVANIDTPPKFLTDLNFDLDGDQVKDSYAWTFTTKTDATFCSLDSVGTQPKTLTLPDGGARALYTVNPRSKPDQCDPNGQRLNAYQFDWQWKSVDLTAYPTPPPPFVSGATLFGVGWPSGLPLIPPALTQYFPDGCGNGVIEYGESCDRQPPDYLAPGCTSQTCQLLGSNPCVGPGSVDCCGNGKIETAVGVGESCDDGDTDLLPNGLNGAVPDYCSDRCLWAGNTNRNEPVCGNGKIEYKTLLGPAIGAIGEECDNGQEPNSNDADGCTDTCRYSGAVPGSPAVCGDGQIGLGEECDYGELKDSDAFPTGPLTGDVNGCTGTSAEYASGLRCDSAGNQSSCQDAGHRDRCFWTGDTCQPRPCILEDRADRACINETNLAFDFSKNVLDCGTGYHPQLLSWAAGNNRWHISVCGNSRVESGEACDDGNVANAGDGCSNTCLFTGPVSDDNRGDPYQIVSTIDRLPSGLPINADGLVEVKEEIRAWHALDTTRVGVGELTVQGRANVPFVVVSNQPAAGATNQCRNVALWAILSQPVDPNILNFTCSDEPDKQCGQDSDCATPGARCQQGKFIIAECTGANSGNCLPGAVPPVSDNQAVEAIVRPIQGQCGPSNHCIYNNKELTSSYCQNSGDCRGSRLEITGLREGFLKPNKYYRLFLSQPITEAGGEHRPLTCDPSSICSWTFSTNADFCQCDYLGVGIYNTHFGNAATDDIFTCAGHTCGVGAADQSKLDVNLIAPGNQHRYAATCYDANNPQQTLIPILAGNLVFNWGKVDVDLILQDLSAAIGAETFVTASGKNGLAYVNGLAFEKHCTTGNNLCANNGNCAGAGTCAPAPTPSAAQRVAVTAFICEQPWEYTDDNDANCDQGACHITNFRLLYCRDNGAAGAAEDLPALNDNAIVRGTIAGSKPIKDFVFPFVDAANKDAIGLRVLPNPLHLSAKTWYETGLCGGVTAIENVCRTDADCQTVDVRNGLVDYWPLDNGSGTTVSDSVGTHSGTIPTGAAGATWVSGIRGGALHFDGGGTSYVEIGGLAGTIRGGAVPPAILYSVSLWLKTAALNGRALGQDEQDNTLCTAPGHCTDGVAITLENGKICGKAVNDIPLPVGAPEGSKLCTGQAFNDDRWHHVVIERSEIQYPISKSTGKLYVDGKLVAQGLSGGSNNDGGGSLKLGADYEINQIPPGKSADSFKGTIDEVRLYNRPLSDEEVSALYRSIQGGATCQPNVPTRGTAKTLVVDGYGAVQDGRSVYVAASNFASPTLFSNIYLLSHNQDASDQTVEIFNRLLDPKKQKGDWRFNFNIPDWRVCTEEQGIGGGPVVEVPIGLFAGTKQRCYPDSFALYAQLCAAHTVNGQASCVSDPAESCQWSTETNLCVSRACEPIACGSNFDCPNFRCNADKQKVVRDTERYGDLRDIQVAIKRQPTVPDLAAGTYIQKTSFSVWPSWQATLGDQLKTPLPTDPLNRLKGCPGYTCDGAAGGTFCDPFDPDTCGSQPEKCLVVDQDQAKTCWNEATKRFACPLDGFVYGYQATGAGAGYQLYANFEYDGSGSWINGIPAYELPAGSGCRFVDFSTQAIGSGGVPPAAQCLSKQCYGGSNNPAANPCNLTGTTADCPDRGPGTFCSGDADADGYCDWPLSAKEDNCSPIAFCTGNIQSCYNPDQRDSNGNTIGDVCDPICSGDSDHDGVCNEVDICRTVYNQPNQGICSNDANRQCTVNGDCAAGGICRICQGRQQDPATGQCDADADRVGDVCDPCTDLDRDGWWDINTGANDEAICRRDNAPAGFCAATGAVCSPASVCPGGGDCQYDPVYNDPITYPPAGHPIVVRNFLANDRFGYCVDANNNPIPQQRCCLASGQYSPGICASSPDCGDPSCNGVDFATYNPNQEDFDGRKLGAVYLGDGIGYIADDCVDSDLDGFGDWPFFRKSFSYCDASVDLYPDVSEEIIDNPAYTYRTVADCTAAGFITVPWDWHALTVNEQGHFQGCQGGLAPAAAPGDFRTIFTPWNLSAPAAPPGASPVTLSGRITGNGLVLPITGAGNNFASVELRRSDSSIFKTALTDANGDYAFIPKLSVSADAYTIYVIYPGFSGKSSAPFTLTADRLNTNLDLTP